MRPINIITNILSIEIGPSLLHSCLLLVSLLSTGLSPVQSEVVTYLFEFSIPSFHGAVYVENISLVKVNLIENLCLFVCMNLKKVLPALRKLEMWRKLKVKSNISKVRTDF